MKVEEFGIKNAREAADRLIAALDNGAPRLDEDGCSRFSLQGNVPVELFLMEFQKTLFATAGLIAIDTASAEILNYAAQVNHLWPSGLDGVFLVPKGSRMICLATALHIGNAEEERFVGEFNNFTESVALVRDKMAELEPSGGNAFQPEREMSSRGMDGS